MANFRGLRAILYFVAGFLLMVNVGLANAATYRVTGFTNPNVGSMVANGCIAPNSFLVGAQWEAANATEAMSKLHAQLNTSGSWTNSATQVTYTVSRIDINGVNAFKCYWSGTNGTNSSGDMGVTWSATSQSCPAGTTRNATTGLCEGSPQQQCESAGGYWGGNNTVGGLFEPTESCYAATPQCMESGGVVATVNNLDGRCGVYQAPCPADYGDPVSPGNLGGGQCLYGGTPPEPDPDPDPEPDPNKPDQTPSGCGAGQDSGTVNGVPVCINRPPSNSSDSKTETKTNPDGSTTETTKTTNTTVNNTTNTTTTTTTTTVVHKDSTGAVTGTETTTETQEQSTDGYCEANPDSTVCGGGQGGWQGGCDDPGRVVHECKGDPIQCAIAEQTLRTRCALAASDEVVEAFEEMKNFDGTGEGEGLDRREIQVPETLEVNEIGGGAGLTDKTFVIMGQSIEVPFSLINSYLDIFGAAVMMIAWIVAFNTIRGAI